MNNLNSVSLSGNMVNDAVMRTTQSGMSIATFVLAVNRKFGQNEEVAYIDCKIFGKLADAVYPFMTKGKGIIVSGRITQERWEKDGQNRSKLVVAADFIQLGGEAKHSNVDADGSRPSQNRSYPEKHETTTPSVVDQPQAEFTAMCGAEQFDDDIPF